MYETSLQSLGDAVAQQQTGAISLTTPQINAISTQTDVIQGRANALVAQGQAQTGNTTQSAPPSIGDLFIQYADTIGIDNMPTFFEFERMYNEGGETWNELLLRKGWKDALQSGGIEPFTRFEEYQAMVEEGGNETGDVVKLKQLKFYTPIEYTGTVKVDGNVVDVNRRVYQRSDINLSYYDPIKEMTNYERMKLGKPPIGPDGNAIELHHLTQLEAGQWWR